jgi:hypothetical protein
LLISAPSLFLIPIVNYADFGLIAVINIHYQLCQFWAHHRRRLQSSILLTLGSLPSLTSSIDLADFELIAIINFKL